MNKLIPFDLVLFLDGHEKTRVALESDLATFRKSCKKTEMAYIHTGYEQNRKQ